MWRETLNYHLYAHYFGERDKLGLPVHCLVSAHTLEPEWNPPVEKSVLSNEIVEINILV